MIIKTVFHTYRDSFPLIGNGRLPPPLNKDNLVDQMTSLILDLSDLISSSYFAFMARHTNDTIPKEHLDPFLTKYSNFVDSHGQDKKYNIPAVWLVGHFKTWEEATGARLGLGKKGVKYFEDSDEYDSFESIYHKYWDNKIDAHLFPKFLHQVTMIGIDLLKTYGFKQKLTKLKRLEWLQYENNVNMNSDLMEMKIYLKENSQYYQGHIFNETSEYEKFWKNFVKIKGDRRIGLGSWPHFLFNICGV